MPPEMRVAKASSATTSAMRIAPVGRDPAPSPTSAGPSSGFSPCEARAAVAGDRRRAAGRGAAAPPRPLAPDDGGPHARPRGGRRDRPDPDHCVHCGEEVVASWATNPDGSPVYVHAATGNDRCDVEADLTAESEPSDHHPVTGPMCPVCGAPDTRRIRYGLPAEPPPEDVVDGGCVISPDGDDPTHECRGRERHRWRR
jgi:hypothetical protein